MCLFTRTTEYLIPKSSELIHSLPHSVGDRAVAVQPHHLVFVSDVMQKGVLVIGEECVRHPDLLCEVSRQRHQVRVVVGVGKPLVPPVLI